MMQAGGRRAWREYNNASAKLSETYATVCRGSTSRPFPAARARRRTMGGDPSVNMSVPVCHTGRARAHKCDRAELAWLTGAVTRSAVRAVPLGKLPLMDKPEDLGGRADCLPKR